MKFCIVVTSEGLCPQFNSVIQNIENHCAILTPVCLCDTELNKYVLQDSYYTDLQKYLLGNGTKYCIAQLLEIDDKFGSSH